jgi:hypothetical protein
MDKEHAHKPDKGPENPARREFLLNLLTYGLVASVPGWLGLAYWKLVHEDDETYKNVPWTWIPVKSEVDALEKAKIEIPDFHKWLNATGFSGLLYKNGAPVAVQRDFITTFGFGIPLGQQYGADLLLIGPSTMILYYLNKMGPSVDNILSMETSGVFFDPNKKPFVDILFDWENPFPNTRSVLRVTQNDISCTRNIHRFWSVPPDEAYLRQETNRLLGGFISNGSIDAVWDTYNEMAARN